MDRSANYIGIHRVSFTQFKKQLKRYWEYNYITLQKTKADPGHSDAVEDNTIIRSTDIATKEISTMTYTEEQLNYFRMVYIVMNIFSTELRGLFKREWNFAYRKPWRDTTTDGSFFCGQESPGNKRNKKFELALIAKGDSNKFDSTTLFYCLLYSTSLGQEIRVVAHATGIQMMS